MWEYWLFWPDSVELLPVKQASVSPETLFKSKIALDKLTLEFFKLKFASSNAH